MDNSEIRYLGDLQRLDLKSGDRLVLRAPGFMSQETADRLKAILQEWAGQGVPILVLGDGCAIGVIGKAPE